LTGYYIFLDGSSFSKFVSNELVQSAKYLGVSITSDMKWSEHIANVCKKANNNLSFLRRNLNISNSNLKEKA
jgi:hypothetical protein